jgi:hypothetical protein
VQPDIQNALIPPSERQLSVKNLALFEVFIISMAAGSLLFILLASPPATTILALSPIEKRIQDSFSRRADLEKIESYSEYLGTHRLAAIDIPSPLS